MAASQTLHSTKNIRNIAVVGHAGSGKTTLIEALLEKSGAIKSAGSVDKGTTVCDYTDQEKRLQHSLEASMCHLEIDGTFINLLDTPGYPDFMGRALSVLPAVDTVAIVVNAQTGVELVTQRMMDFSAQRKLCRLIIINKIDAENVNLEGIFKEIRKTFGRQCLPLNLPAQQGKAIADCFFEPADETPDFASVEAAHTEIFDQVVELDDELMEAYLEQGDDISLEQLHDPFERALRAGHLIPVCFVSSDTGAGIQQLLRILSKLMPNPMEGNPPEFFNDQGEEKIVTISAGEVDSHFVGHVFKVNVDPYVGRLATFRVHQGSVKKGDQVFVGDQRKTVRLAHLFQAQGKNLKEISTAVSGDLCSVSKIEDLRFDSVIHSSHDEDELHMKSVQMPAPMYGVALELTQRGQEKKMSDALHKLTAEDPSVKVEFNAQANETVLRGMGELHLRMVLERMKEEFGIKISTHPPKIAYLETVTREAEGHHRHKKQTGGAGQFGEVFLRIEPLPRGSGFEFSNKVVGGTIPRQFIPAVEKGVKQVLDDGAIAGYPLQDVKVIVYDGKYHPVDSKEVAFVAAGKRAFADAISKAEPIVLEPIAKIEVTTPSSYVGDITGHLSGVRGRIAGSVAVAGNRVRISAEVPLAELGNYQTTLKSLTAGEGSFTMELDHYERTPPAVQKDLEKAFRPAAKN
uniref:Elongation factor G n=1 Tax=uncultured gamma proteobacterium HF0770_28K04 TaxID=723578 RepID=E7C7F8_9GAMM|nr:translation elongation factors (GTPases) [uncultured gamma proteobacterium HF0770_28K04]